MELNEKVKGFIEDAKALVIKERTKLGEIDVVERKWLEFHIDSYNSSANRLSVYVLEGSPPKGVIIANFPIGIVRVFDSRGNQLKIYEAY